MSLHADDLTSLDAYSNVSRRDGSKQTIIPSHPCRDNHCEDTRFEEGGGEDPGGRVEVGTNVMSAYERERLVRIQVSVCGDRFGG